MYSGELEVGGIFRYLWFYLGPLANRRKSQVLSVGNQLFRKVSLCLTCIYLGGLTWNVKSEQRITAVFPEDGT